MIRQSSHLSQIAHGGFAAIVLPVGVRRKRGRCVESKIGAYRRKFLRIPGQDLLGALDQIQHQHGNAAEEQHGEGVFRPAHLVLFIHQGQAVQEALDRAQHRVEKCSLAVEHARHEHADGLGERQYHGEINDDLKPAIYSHWS